jgi:hypothetical protein
MLLELVPLLAPNGREPSCPPLGALLHRIVDTAGHRRSPPRNSPTRGRVTDELDRAESGVLIGSKRSTGWIRDHVKVLASGREESAVVR